MRNRARFIAIVQEALGAIDEPRLFRTERGYQGELLAELRSRIREAQFPGDPIVEQEYQKTIPRHNLAIRPDLIVHVPFDRGETARRTEGNFVAIEIKRDPNDVETAFENLRLMRQELRYPLTIFIMVDSGETFAELCPRGIAGQTVCFAVSLQDGEPVVRRKTVGRPRPRARKRVAVRRAVKKARR
jgi:hypothetical protein